MSLASAHEPPGGIAFYMHDLSGGGVERMRLLLIDALRARGRRVILVVQSADGPLKPLLPADLPLVVLGRGGTLASLPSLVRFLRASRPDILVSSLDHNNIAALVAKCFSRTGTRLVICQHNALSAEGALGWRYRLVPVLYGVLHRLADGIVAVSNGVADDLSAAAGIERGRITTIYNPVIDPAFHERAAPSQETPRLHDPSRPTLVFAGRLTEQKDPRTLLQAFAMLLPILPARLLILGDGPLRRELEEAAQGLGIAAFVSFAGYQAHPLPWIAQASALVLSSRYEGLGNVIVEALALGIPVIATDCPFGPAEILENGRFGVLAPPGDPAALSAAMRRCLETRWDRDRLRQRGACFSAAICADRHLALFDAIARKPVFGMTLSGLSAAQTVDAILTTRPKAVDLVVTPNLDHLRLLRRPDFAEAYASAVLCCPDGLPILLYARLRGLRLRARVTGCELFHRLAAHPGLRTQRLFIVTESGETASEIERWARQGGLDGHLEAATAGAGLLHDQPAQADLARRIAAFSPSILVMTLGAPTSEIFIHQNRASLPACWALCIGQAVRVELGLARRAPPAWQGLGIEWLWRLCHEPRRLALRYAKSALWFPLAILADLRARPHVTLLPPPPSGEGRGGASRRSPQTHETSTAS